MKFLKHLLNIFVVLLFTSVICSGQSNNEIDKKVDELLSKMTLDEKIGQMQQLAIFDQGIPDYISERLKSRGAGSFLNVTDVKTKNALQKIMLEETRLGIPILFGRDVIHGYRTVFPIPIGQASSWNPELIEKAARIAAIEAASEGYRWTFAPMMDMTRDPRWGRIAETTGEDPYLTSILTTAMIKGFQGDDLTDLTSMAACAKHYVGYGAADGGRDYNTTEISERTLREYYLPPFKSASDNGALTFMSAFNEINGVPATGNKFTLRNILKDEWEFKGFVVSDWASMPEMKLHGFCEDDSCVALKSIEAGCDMEMVTDAYHKTLKDLVEDGSVDEALVDDAVSRILRVKFALGLFDNPYTDENLESPILSKEFKETAKELSAESIVLLKNDDILPLSKNINSIAVIGPLADAGKDQLGTWSMDGKDEESITPLTSLIEYVGETKINYAVGLETSRTIDKDDFSDAIAAANKSDAIILFLGEEAVLSGEAHSRAFLNLPGVQEELVDALYKTGKPIITVIMAGRPLTFGTVSEKSNAVLYAWHPGTMAGPAITDLIFGNINPSGKLPVTFPITIGQIPIHYNHKNTGRPPSEDMLGIELGTPEDPKGFASNYLDVDFTPAYPFGYGLSYTDFEYSDLKLSATEMSMDTILEAEIMVTNIGDTSGKEIVQLYIRDKVASTTRPVKELKGFQKIFLNAGESKIVKFSITKKDLAFWNIDMEYVAEPGKFDLWIGPNSQEGLKANFTLK